MAPKVIVVLTSYGHIEASNKPTGWYLPELAHPYDVLSSKGVEIVVASPAGGAAPLDPASVEAFKSDASSTAFLESKKAVWENTQKISSFHGKSGDYAALFYPGGHGPMFDLPRDADSIALIKEFVAAGKPVAAVCHGPAAFTGVTLDSGKHLLAGKEVTGFTNVEEDQAKMSEFMPFMLEDRMKAVGGDFKKAAEPWAEFVLVQDGGKFITGQNPASAKAVGEAIAKSIGV
ncbi:Uu.00g143470.m01.CDS01 [Anthostomella pinea]|uniref:D-lactate dehydratase n=1 Tax=Anthostomella pinea TaxID=933095 RepID=A0AAI8VQS4_9PEZI|nr:Uu.00g143470.m01.CDS01 [Anthostomella pinea]